MNYPDLQVALYLLPIGISDAPPAETVPSWNIEIMKRLKHFVVENVRTARRWIRRCDPGFSFDGVEFIELNTHTDASEVPGMLEPLRCGYPMGVMSEAGCPAIADPGADIVAAAQREGLQVVPLVGPSSILLSLMGSGFNGQSFCFHGYLPIYERERRHALQRLEKESERENRTQIFIETPYRNGKLMSLMTEVLANDTKVCVACDLTDPEKQKILTRDIAEWRKNPGENLDKHPAVFLLYRGKNSPADLIYSTKGGKKR